MTKEMLESLKSLPDFMLCERKRLGLSQLDLSALIGAEGNSIKKVENSKYLRSSASYLIRILKELYTADHYINDECKHKIDCLGYVGKYIGEERRRLNVSTAFISKAIGTSTARYLVDEKKHFSSSKLERIIKLLEVLHNYEQKQKNSCVHIG